MYLISVAERAIGMLVVLSLMGWYTPTLRLLAMKKGRLDNIVYLLPGSFATLLDLPTAVEKATGTYPRLFAMLRMGSNATTIGFVDLHKFLEKCLDSLSRRVATISRPETPHEDSELGDLIAVDMSRLMYR
jgi:hypothetical protein